MMSTRSLSVSIFSLAIMVGLTVTLHLQYQSLTAIACENNTLLAAINRETQIIIELEEQHEETKQTLLTQIHLLQNIGADQ